MFYPIAKYDIPIIILIIFYFIFSGTVTVMNVFPFDKHYGFTYTDVLILKRALFRPCIKFNLIVYILWPKLHYSFHPAPYVRLDC